MRNKTITGGATALLLILALAPGVQAGLSAPPGYGVSSVLSVSPTDFLGGMDYLSSGELLYFDGTELSKSSGGTSTPLFDPPGFVFGSFLKVVGGSTIYFGESTDMKIYQVASTGGGTEVAEIQYNFDLENYGSELYVSYNASTSPPPGDPEAAVARLTLPGGALDIILGNTGGHSGPLTFDGAGNMYYCKPNSTFGQPGVDGLYYFTRAQVAGAFGAGELALGDGVDLGDDLTGCYDMEYDNQYGRIFVTAGNDFTDQIEVYDVSSGTVSTFATKTSGTYWSTYLRFRPGSKTFLPNNGLDAGVLSVVQNETVYEIRPSQGGQACAGVPAAEAAEPGTGSHRRPTVANGFSLLFLPAVTVIFLALRNRRKEGFNS